MTGRIFLTLISLLLCGTLMAQDQRAVREQLLGAADAAKAKADGAHAAMLAPDAYARGMTIYKEAGETLEKGRNMDRVREQARQATSFFNTAAEKSDLAKATFASTLTARSAAEHAEAAKYAAREWQRAEESLVDAARKLEGGNLKGATKDADDVEKRYKEAELKALNAAKAQPSR